jgi:hypothetical protein
MAKRLTRFLSDVPLLSEGGIVGVEVIDAWLLRTTSLLVDDEEAARSLRKRSRKPETDSFNPSNVMYVCAATPNISSTW